MKFFDAVKRRWQYGAVGPPAAAAPVAVDQPSIDGLGIGMRSASAPPSPVASAFSIIKMLSLTQGNLPRGIHARDDLSRKPVLDRQHQFLWGQPNIDWRTGANSWWTMVFAHFEGWSNDYLFLRTTGSRVMGIDAIHPSRVMPRLTDSGQKEFVVDRGTLDERILTPDEMLHIPGLTFDGVRGISPVEASIMAHQTSHLLSRWQQSFLRRGPSTSVVVTANASSGKYDQAATDAFYRRWDQRHSGIENTGGAILVQNGTSVHPLVISPADAEHLAAQKYSREEVLGLYAPGLPHHLLGWSSNTSNFGTGVEAQARHLVQYVLLNRLAMIADAISQELLPPELEFEFHVKQLLRGDAKTQAEVFSKMRDRAALSADEWRGETGWAPRGIPDDFTLGKNSTALDAKTGEPTGIDEMTDEPEGDAEMAGAAEGEPEATPPIAMGARCGNAQCRSRRGHRAGRLLVQNIADRYAVCPECGERTEFEARAVLRDEADYYEAVGEILIAAANGRSTTNVN